GRLLLRLGRLLPVLGLVFGGKLGFFLRMADEALRIGPVVLLAPVAFRFALGGVLGVTLAADLLPDAVLVTPFAAVVVGFLLGDRLGFLFRFGFWGGGLAATDDQQRGRRDHQHQTGRKSYQLHRFLLRQGPSR